MRLFVFTNRLDSSFLTHTGYFEVFSELDVTDQDTHLEAAISILDTMEGVAS